jgi:hypothetical protein
MFLTEYPTSIKTTPITYNKDPVRRYRMWITATTTTTTKNLREACLSSGAAERAHKGKVDRICARYFFQ